MLAESKEPEMNVPMINYVESSQFSKDQDLVDWLKQLKLGEDVVDLVSFLELSRKKYARQV